MHESGAIPLNWVDLTIAALLILVAGAVNLALRLEMEQRLALAAVRTVAQLLLVGYVLQWVFELEHPLLIAALALLMTAAAARASVASAKRFYIGAYWRAFSTLAVTGILITFVVTRLIIGVEPWFRPQYLVPLLGMVFGNSLTGLSLCLDKLLELLSRERERIEAELALGASSWEAARGPVAEAVRTGMIPILNAMMVVGIVSIPGMMTGQILQGADPSAAVKYQIVVMFMLAASTSLGCVGMALLAYRRLFNERHQLRSERIRIRHRAPLA
jgi:putative ABC transport system permease protein